MTENKELVIYIVDDDQSARLTLTEFLSDLPYQVFDFNGGDSCLSASAPTPDIVLLDVEMPGMNGYETCRNLRNDKGESVHVIFVSSHESIDARVEAYQAGANDYIVKPVSPEELRQKIKIAQNFKQQKQQLAETAQFAQKTAFTAMSSMGELGHVLQFLRESFSCQSLQQLAALMLSTLEQYELHGFVRMNNQYEQYEESHHGACSPLELSILEYAQKVELRIAQSGKYLATKYPHVVCVVTDLPEDDSDFIGRIRDHLASMVEGASSRMIALTTEHKFALQAQGLVDTSRQIAKLIEEIEKQQFRQRVSLTYTLSEYRDNLEESFLNLGLTELQEKQLLDMVTHLLEKTDSLLDESEVIAKQMDAANKKLASLHI